MVEGIKTPTEMTAEDWDTFFISDGWRAFRKEVEKDIGEHEEGLKKETLQHFQGMPLSPHLPYGIFFLDYVINALPKILMKDEKEKEDAVRERAAGNDTQDACRRGAPRSGRDY